MTLTKSYHTLHDIRTSLNLKTKSGRYFSSAYQMEWRYGTTFVFDCERLNWIKSWIPW